MDRRIVLNTVWLTLVTSAALSGQNACPDMGNAGTASATLSLVTATGACSLANGGFARSSVSYKIHLQATVTGGCITRDQQCSGLPPQCTCVTTGNYYRTIGTTFLFDATQQPIGHFAAIWADNSPTVQHVDTTVPTGTTSTGANWFPTVQGWHNITSNTGWNATPCMLTPTTFQSDQPITAHVMACRPEWFTGGQPGDPVVNFRAPDSGTVTIVIPSVAFEDARVPAEAAAAAWSIALGRTVQVQAGYANCSPSDNLCIELANDQGTKPGDAVGCAAFGTNTYNPSTGVWAGSTRIRFEPNWTGGHADNLQRTIAHELGHYFGLANRTHVSCPTSSTVMGATDCYGAQAPAAGTALGPTASDASALLNSTYTTAQVRSICGW